MSTTAETNNNDIVTSFEVAERRTEGRSVVSALCAKLTPGFLRVIIVLLILAIIVCISVTVAIVVTNLLSVSEPWTMNTTMATPTAASTTLTTTSTTITEPSSSPSSLSSSSTSSSTTTSSTSPKNTTSMLSPSSSSSSPPTSTTTTTTQTTPSSSPSPSSSSSSSTSTSTTSSTTTVTTTEITTSTSTVSTTTDTATTSTTAIPECAETQYLCASGECVPWLQVCDGLPQCKDGSDEGVDCACAYDQWECTSGQCIPAEARCDHAEDCQDSSDEMQCPDCSGFQCDTGLCLWDSNDRRCDGIFDCPDLSDEMGCSARAGTRPCNNTVRIPQSKWCDGVDNCGDNSDEIDCTSVCRGHRVGCPDGHCIMKTWQCDGYNDCQDGSDEVGCGTCLSTQFMCDNYQCINESAVCDGTWNCKTGEDELHCFSLQEENSGMLWARYKGKDYAVCADHWNTDFAVQICIDIDQLQLSGWKEVIPSLSVSRFMAFSNNTLSAQTTNLLVRSSCQSGKVIDLTCRKEECGNRKVAFLQSFVAGGQIVSPGKWPWMASLMHLGKFICGGTVISPNWVATAAHCILDALKGDYDFTSTPFYFDVILGSTHRMGQSRVGTPTRVRVERVVLHPNHTRLFYGGVDWDLALLKLAVAVSYSDYVQPLCLPHEGQTVPLTSLCYMAGWGLMNPQQVLPSEDLRDTRMQLWSERRCATNTIPGESVVNTDSTLCGGFLFGTPSSCQGDSGGPLMCLSTSRRWMLAGVMSRGSTPCGLYHPSIRANRFARVANMVDWIRQLSTET